MGKVRQENRPSNNNAMNVFLTTLKKGRGKVPNARRKSPGDESYERRRISETSIAKKHILSLPGGGIDRKASSKVQSN